MNIVMVGCAILLSFPASVASQPRPIAATTLVTTDTSVASICAGANSINAPSTCLGGIQMGTSTINLGLTLPSFTPAVTTNRLYSNGGTLFWNGSAVAVGGSVGPGTTGTLPVFTGVNSIGNSLFSQSGTVMTLAGTLVSTVQGQSSFTTAAAGQESVLITNTAAGAGNSARLAVASNTVTAFLDSYSSTFTTSGASRQSGSLLSSNGSDGLGLSASVGPIRFYAGSAVQRGQITAAGLFSWETFGAHTFSGSGVGGQSVGVGNSLAGAGNFASVTASSDTVTSGLQAFSSTWTTSGANVQAGSTLFGNGTGGLSLAALQAAGAVRIYTGGGALRATYDAAGNFNLGSTNIMDSPAVPTNAGAGFCTGTVAGRNTAFVVTLGTCGGPTSGTVNFNMTYTNPPVCTASMSQNSAAFSLGLIPTTTTLVINITGLTTGDQVFVHCRGY